MIKIRIENGERLIYKPDILYEDDDFCVCKSLLRDKILVMPRGKKSYARGKKSYARGKKSYNNIKELPEYIRDIVLREVI